MASASPPICAPVQAFSNPGTPAMDQLIQAIAGIKDEQIRSALDALKTAVAGQQDQQRKHSFQLVKLRSDVEEMRKHLNEGGAGTAEPTMEMQELTSEVRDLHSKMAMMKGKIAQLTMEIHMDGESPDHRLPGSDDESDPSISQHGRIKNSSSSGRPIKDCDPGNQLAFWSRVQASMGNLDKLADQLLQEKRSQLVTSLESLYEIANQLKLIRAPPSIHDRIESTTVKEEDVDGSDCQGLL